MKNILIYGIIGMLVSSLLLASAVVPVTGSSYETLDLNEVSRAGARAQTKNLTFYLQDTTSANYVFNYSTTSIMNTVVGNNQQHLADWGTVITSWYLFPTLAEDFHILGDVEIAMKINMSSESNNLNGNLDMKLYDVEHIDAVGTVTETVIPNTPHGESETFLTSIDIYGIKAGGIDYVVQKGHSIRAEFSVSGGAGNKYHVWFGDNLHDSHLILETTSFLQVDDVYTKDYKDEVKTNFELDVSDKTIDIITEISDPLGGYDIKMVNVTLESPTGSVILDNLGMALFEGNNISYVSKFHYLWNYSGADIGTYNLTVWAVDWSGYNYYHHLSKFNYGVHPDTGIASFVIGGKPLSGNVTILDSKSLPLVGAVVKASIAGSLKDINVTNGMGVVGLAGYPGLYTIHVFWQDVLVKTQSDFDFKTDLPLTLICDVFYPDFKFVDNSGLPLKGANIYIGHPNGSFAIVPLVTDENGTISLIRAPVGNYQIIAKWRDIEVANVIEYVSMNGLIDTIICKVFSVQITVVDSRSVGLPKAQIVISDKLTRLVLDSQISSFTGVVSSQLPLGDYVVSVYWLQRLVKEYDLSLTTDYTDTIICDVFYVNFLVLDTHKVAVESAQITITDPDTGAFFVSEMSGTSGLMEARLPTGEADVKVYWKGILVNTSKITITGDAPGSAPVELNCAIYYLTLNCIDSRSEPLERATVMITHSSNSELVDVVTTGDDGIVVFRLAISSYDISIKWLGTVVFTESNYALSKDTTRDIVCQVFYVNIIPVDSREETLENARIDIYDLTTDLVVYTKVVGPNGSAQFRLPANSFAVEITWLDINVSYTIESIIKGGNIAIRCHVYYLTFHVVDVAGTAVENAKCFVNYNLLTNIYDSGITGPSGEIVSRLPWGNYSISVYWKDVEVFQASDVILDKDMTYICNSKIYYLTIKTVDNGNIKLKDVMINVSNIDTNPALVEAEYSDKKGFTSFRLPHGTYNVDARFITTYYYEDIDHKVSTQVDLTGSSQEITIEFKDYPPPIYSTPLFGMVTFAILAIVFFLLLWLLVIRKLQKAVSGGKEEELPVKKERKDLDKADEAEPGIDDEEEPPLAGPAEDDVLPGEEGPEELPPAKTEQTTLSEEENGK